MIRVIVRTGVLLVANAVGLIIAAIVLDGMRLGLGGFLLAVVIFTVAAALLQPFLVTSMLRQGAGAGALGGVALLATLISLIVTAVLSDGLSINGVDTWLLATVMVWGVGLLAAFLLPFLGLKKYMGERR